MYSSRDEVVLSKFTSRAEVHNIYLSELRFITFIYQSWGSWHFISRIDFEVKHILVAKSMLIAIFSRVDFYNI